MNQQLTDKISKISLLMLKIVQAARLHANNLLRILRPRDRVFYALKTVYFQLKTVYIPPRPWIFGPRPYIFRQDRIFYQERIFYFSGPYILLSNRFIFWLTFTVWHRFYFILDYTPAPAAASFVELGSLYRQ